jgi:hypothetical protein
MRARARGGLGEGGRARGMGGEGRRMGDGERGGRGGAERRSRAGMLEVFSRARTGRAARFARSLSAMSRAVAGWKARAPVCGRGRTCHAILRTSRPCHPIPRAGTSAPPGRHGLALTLVNHGARRAEGIFSKGEILFHGSVASVSPWRIPFSRPFKRARV